MRVKPMSARRVARFVARADVVKVRDAIWVHGPGTVYDIAHTTGINPPAVRLILVNMITARLVKSVPAGGGPRFAMWAE